MNPPAVIQLDHVYAHPPSAVWKALTTPELHAKWWAAGDVRPVVGRRAFEGMKPGWPGVLARLGAALGV
ncbi:hypothetical protein D7X55_05245 [Corallococcus sp. AB049A]|uniref:SRPBCC family protein n=1 Tax=Corallococcus sp. AB049A TaxID=2316721 RepID=UPI000EA30BE4|nr:SRPBCC domain-containing protein [Corallococcus sp. AB049A]RKH52114.1 hypothetical protein D7Y23_07830 [Corallococcus sp. AB050B]RKI73537.1 hypothetical protein D7X55_05245 [Corallococcus sp. AB049A]